MKKEIKSQRIEKKQEARERKMAWKRFMQKLDNIKQEEIEKENKILQALKQREQKELEREMKVRKFKKSQAKIYKYNLRRSEELK